MPTQDNDSAFLFVSPNHSLTLDKLDGKQKSVVVDVPAQFRNANVYVEDVGRPHAKPTPTPLGL